MATHGHSGVKHWLGSITDRVVKYAGGPVLVCRCA
ncbi:MAG: universal stress protein [Dehalococcoidia bacterium]